MTRGADATERMRPHPRRRRDYAELGDVDLVIEAVFEEMAVKQRGVRRRSTAVCKPGAILATNTSTLDINEIARGDQAPRARDRPALLQPGQHHAPARDRARQDRRRKEVIATSMKLAKTLGKIGVLVGVCHGFVGNRMLYAVPARGAVAARGRRDAAADRQGASTDFGFAMGPFAMSDLAGLDIGWRVRKAQGKPQASATRASSPDRAVRAGPLRPEDRPGLLQATSRQPYAEAVSGAGEDRARRLRRARHRARARSPTKRSCNAASTR